MNDVREEQIIERAKKGDPGAKALIVEKYERMVYNLGLRLLSNHEEAECVLQDTFLKILQSIDTFKGESQLSTWIYRIATNQALMRLRKKKRQYVSIDGDEEDASKDYSNILRSFHANPLEDLLNTELKDKMRVAIDMLPPKHRSVFVLKDIEGLSLMEISNILDMSLPAVKSNLHRARLFLRENLSEFINGKEE